MQHITKQLSLSLFLVFVTALLVSLAFKAGPSRLFQLGCLLICGLDLVVSGRNTVWVTDRSFLTQAPPIVSRLQELSSDLEARSRVALAVMPKQVSTHFVKLYNHAPYLGRTAYYQQSFIGNTSMLYHFRNVYAWPIYLTQVKTLHGIYREAIDNLALRNRLESLLAVRYVLLPHENQELANKFKKETKKYNFIHYYPEIDLSLWENINWQPRVYFQYQALVSEKEQDILKELLEGQVFDPQRNVLLLKDEHYQQAMQQIPSQESTDKHWTKPRIVEEGNNRLRIKVSTNTSGYLVLADQFYPGWQAYDNGKPTPILQANYLQRAVRVGVGQHEILFDYKPRSFMWGTLGSILSLLVAVCLWRLSKLKQIPLE